MSVEAEHEIIDELEATESLTLEQLIQRVDHNSQDTRRALDFLLRENGPVYVDGVEDKQKQYAIEEDD